MRPNQNGRDATPKYRRQSNGGGSRSRIVIVLALGIGAVITSVILAGMYGLSSSTESDQRITTPLKINSRAIIRAGVNSPRDATVLASEAPSGLPGDSTTNPGGVGDTNLTNERAADFPGSAAPEDRPIPTATIAGCVIQGRVTDNWGSPIVGVVVRATTADGNIIETITDSRGRYALPGAIQEPDPDAETVPGAVEVSVVLSHGIGTGASFAVMNGDDVVALTTSVSDTHIPGANACEQNFDTWNIQDDMETTPIETDLWPDATAIYQYILNAEKLALDLGADIDSATTLQIQVWCNDPALGCDESKTGAFFVAENELEEGSAPIITMMPARSSLNSPGIPDNREFHEYGHYFLWLQTGETFELPSGDRNHGGYYRNTSTRDSFVEGFAEFYSMMVSRQIVGDYRFEIYTIGADYDLEADRLPWEAEGWWEEFTIAGLLLDLVDSDADYAERASGPSGLNVLDVTVNAEPSGTIVQGKIVNTSPLVVRNADVTVRYMNSAGEVVGTQVTKIIPEIIAPTREGVFYAAPPAGLDVTAATATMGGIARVDDDDVVLDLQQLINLITEYERSGPDASVGVSNVAELYEALMNGTDTLTAEGAQISSSRIDDLFVSHGFFADLDGNKKYEPEVDGDIGQSSHPVSQVGGTSYPAIIPRSGPGAFDGSFVSVNAGDEGVTAVVQISMPASGGSTSYAYVTTLSGSDRIELAVPASHQDAEVTIITAGKDFKPVIAFRVNADDFNERVENGTISELQITPVELEPGTNVAALSEINSMIQFRLIVGGLVAMLLVVSLLLVINRKWGKI